MAAGTTGSGPSLESVPMSTIRETGSSWCRNQVIVNPRHNKGTPTASAICFPICRDPVGLRGESVLLDPTEEPDVSVKLELAHVSCMRSSVWRRSQSGAGMNTGAPPSRATGLTRRRCSSPQVSHDSMWRAMRLRIRTVNCPSQPLRMATNAGHALLSVRALRASSSAPRHRSTVCRSRNTMVFALVRVTSRTSASSGPSKPCR